MWAPCRISSADFGVSNSNYAVGTLAYHPERHALFVAGHAHHNAIALFAIPDELASGTEVSDLTLVEAPLQDFWAPLAAAPHGNPQGLDKITGMLYVDGQLIINAERWYDAPGANTDTTLVVRDADAMASAGVDGFFFMEGAARAAGYMATIPPEWQEAFGAPYLTGWASNYSIIGRYSVGPSFYAFDPGPALAACAGDVEAIATQAFMVFPHGEGTLMGVDALQSQEGSASALWNFLSRAVYGFIVPGTRTFMVLGSSGGVESGIGYKITQDNGNLCGGYCAYSATDVYNYYWLFDLEAILAAEAPHEVRPYAYGPWSVPFDAEGRHPIIGATFDPASKRLYVALANAGRTGTYDRPPLMVVFATP